MSKNAQLFERASHVIPGGVNSPVRAFGSVGGTPRFITHGKGAKIWDAEGKEYIDYIGSWGPAILGHADPEVLAAVTEAAQKGLSFGAPTEKEIEIAELLVARIPSIEMVRLVSSGTEATMSAIRLARGYTKRHKIIKFEGCYHGHADSLLVKAGSGLLTLGNPTSAGVPPEFVEHTLVLPYNDLDALSAVFREYHDQIACVIVEPVAGNMNLIQPLVGYLEGMRSLCTQYGAVLIFDEVMTGFRVGPQGVQGLLNITPDLTTLGKVIGGGMPVGAFGGKKEIMQCIAPLGPVYQAGTLSGNPVAVVAGITTLTKIAAPGFYESIQQQCTRLVQGIQAAAQKVGIPCTADHIGTMFGIYFTDTIPRSYQAVTQSNTQAFSTFFHSLLDQGVYFAPSAYEAGFLSICHTAEIIDETLVAVERALQIVQQKHY